MLCQVCGKWKADTSANATGGTASRRQYIMQVHNRKRLCLGRCCQDLHEFQPRPLSQSCLACLWPRKAVAHLPAALAAQLLPPSDCLAAVLAQGLLLVVGCQSPQLDRRHRLLVSLQGPRQCNCCAALVLGALHCHRRPESSECCSMTPSILYAVVVQLLQFTTDVQQNRMTVTMHDDVACWKMSVHPIKFNPRVILQLMSIFGLLLELT